MKKTLLFLVAALTFGMAAQAQTIFSEDFENVTLSSGIGELPTGWTTYSDDLTNFYNTQGYDYRVFGNSWCVYNMSGWGNCAFCMTYTMEATQVDRWMITPQIAIPETGNYSLVFTVYGSNYNEKLRVLVSTTGVEKTDFTQTLFEGELDPGVSNKLLDLSNFSNQNIYIAFQNFTTDGLYTFIDDVEVKVVPANGIAFVSASAPNYAAMNTNFDVTVHPYNDGSAPLTSYDITYTLNNGSEQTVHVTGQNIAPFSTGSYTFTTSYPTPGPLTVIITLSNPNGVTDADLSDNSGRTSLTIYDPATATQRTVLLEHFTTGQCQYCPSGHERLEQAISSGIEDRVAWVAHHVGFGTDNMTINESNQIATLYGNSGTWAPAMMIDRNDSNSIGNEDDGVIGSVSSVSDLIPQFNNAISTPAYVTVNLSNLTYDPQSRQLGVTVSGEFVSAFGGTEPRLSLYIIQDGIVGRQADAASGTYLNNYVHNHVIRASISNIWGDADAFTNTTAGSTYTKTFNYTLPTKFSANKCYLVAFVNDYGPDILHRTVANATKSGYLMEGNDPTTGIGDVESSINVVTYPNPATEMVYVTVEGQIRSYEMIDALGRTVMAEENVNADILELNVSSLSQGLYIINVTTDRGVAAQRVNIVK